MRVLRSQYLKQQRHVTPGPQKLLKVQTKSIAECDGTIGAASANATTAGGTPSMPYRVVERRYSQYVHKQESINIQVELQQQIRERRATISSDLCRLTIPALAECVRQMNISLLNVEQSNVRQLKLVFDFSRSALNWYNELYGSYENKIWERIERPIPTKSSKWLYKCYLCKKVLCSFVAIKSHLNNHMGWKPHHCADCTKKYPSRSSLLRHSHQTTHQMKIPLMKQIKKNTS